MAVLLSGRTCQRSMSVQLSMVGNDHIEARAKIFVHLRQHFYPYSPKCERTVILSGFLPLAVHPGTVMPDFFIVRFF